MRPAPASVLVAALLAAGCHPKQGPPPAHEDARLDMRVFHPCQLALEEGVTVSQAAVATGLPDTIGKSPAVYGDKRKRSIVTSTREGTCMMAWAKGATPSNHDALLEAFRGWASDVKPVKVPQGEAWCGREASTETTRLLVVRLVDDALIAVMANGNEDCLIEPAEALMPPIDEAPASGGPPDPKTRV